jgi:hypothetical protein
VPPPCDRRVVVFDLTALRSLGPSHDGRPENPDLWEDVKGFLPDGTERERNKKKEILDYVRRIRAYERLARELGCVP